MLVTIDKDDLHYLISQLYEEYFEDYVFDVIEDEDNSVVALFEGMNYCIELCEKYDFILPFDSIKEYFINGFNNGEELYNKLKKRCIEENKIYENSSVEKKNS